MNSLCSTFVLITSLLGYVYCISISVANLHTYVDSQCFNETYDRKPLVLGQNKPVGTSIENLISLIEKVERRRPELNAQQVIILILRRFHIDGLQLMGQSYQQSPVEGQHGRITDQIIQVPNTGPNLVFPEESLSADEKCSLFFTISHTINETARHDEETRHIYNRPKQLARAPVKPLADKMNQTLNTSKHIQSEFLTKNGQKPSDLTRPVRPTPAPQAPKPPQEVRNSKDEDDEEKDDDLRAKRAEPQNNRQSAPVNIFSPNSLRLTKMPREKGAASFRNSQTMAIAVNRVLLGAAVGLIQPAPRTIRDIIKSLVPDLQVDTITDGTIDPLLGVTLSDLLGIDSGLGMTIPAGQVLFGAEGQWNSTACQTLYRLSTNGTMATLAELRGGLDGWNLGRKLPEIMQQNPKLTLSQILRMYYSPKGLSTDSGVCNRNYGLNTELNNKVQSEATNYIRVWNAIQYRGQHPDNQLTGYISETYPTFNQYLQKAGNDKSSDERDFCNPPASTDIKSAPCESSADVFFMLDNMGATDVNIGNAEEIEIVTQVVKALNLGRNAGSVSVFANAQGVSDPSIVDDDNMQIVPPLYTLAYNTTSSQCASCRTAWFDNSQMKITDRPLLLELINKTLMEFEMKKLDLPGVSSKNFVWFDYGNLKPAPTDRDQKNKYDNFKWDLKYKHRDVTFFMATINKEPIKDLLRRDEDWIEVGKGVDYASQMGVGLANKICQTPQVFQHNECRVKKSEDKVYEGFITPGYKQYWGMFPEYFIKSYSIDLRFRAEKAKIKVCFDRSPNPESRDERKCTEAAEEGGEVKWNVKNPCQGKSFENCPGFYFTVTLSSQTGTIVGNECNDPRCKSIDQVKWTFTHSGVSCNSSYSLLPSWTFQLICFILFLSIFFTNTKYN